MSAAKLVSLPIVVCALMCLSARAAEPDDSVEQPAKISYYRQIRPILQEHCHGCHQPAKAMGSLVLTSLDGMHKGGESEEPAVTAGNLEESLLVWQITPQDGDPPAMPKDAQPLSDASVALIKQWISEGAGDDTPQSAQRAYDREHPPTYTQLPVLSAVDYSPDGSLLAVSGYHEVLLHSSDGSKLVGRLVGLSERIESIAFSPDGSLLAATGGSPGQFGEVQIWNVAEQQLAGSLPVTYDSIYGVSWSGDSKRIAFGCTDNTLRAIEVESSKQVLYQGAHSDWVLDTVWSADSSHLVSVSRDRSMKLTEVATERFVDNITSITPGALKGGLMVVDRHPKQDHLLVGGADGVPRLYQMHRTKARKIGDDFNRLRTYEAMPGRIFAVDFNADGSRFVAGSSYNGDGEVRVYQTDDAKIVSKFEGQGGAVYDVAFQPDGKQVASVGFDGMIRLNDVETGKLVKELFAVPLASGEVAAGE